MPREILLPVAPEIAANSEATLQHILQHLQCKKEDIVHWHIRKKSVDARQRLVKIQLRILVYFQGEIPQANEQWMPEYPMVHHQPEVVIIGAGPAGLFAALQLIELGLKPIVLERGKNVKDRRRDLKAINRDHLVNAESNYCFGEGGAGTYSDGKLYTRSKKRGDIDRILHLFVAFGASPEILVDSHPHIGTNKLPGIIEAMREKIIACGGEVHFNSKVVDFDIRNQSMYGVVLENGDKISCNHVILATGHSARDIFTLLYHKGIAIEAKPFALGVRAEHPQSLIDQIQYKCPDRGLYLPPAPYSIVKQVNNRGMYSFCMCPGGIIAPCATNPGEVVTNGWSPSKRDQATANSGIVVELTLEDFKPFAAYGPLAGMKFQESIEQKAWALAGKTQRVPAQRMVDFYERKVSNQIPKTSYIPGTTSVELGEVFPKFLSETLRKGFLEFGQMMRGYFTNNAILHAPESRTSSPVRIPRDENTLQHIQIKGLYPCGEGAGYAGGIVSAAMDGEKCARMIFEKLNFL